MPKRSSTAPFTPLVLSLALCTAGRGSAQVVCALDLGPNRSICSGTSTDLEAPAGMASYLWNTGATTSAITVSSPGQYHCTVTTGEELAVNGDFSAGIIGFSTPFNLNSDLVPNGTYFVGTDAAQHHPNFQGTGNGNFLMVNAAAAHNNWNVWCQTITGCPGRIYTVRFSALDLSGTDPPRLSWYVNNVFHSGPYNVPIRGSGWATFTTTWTAPASGSAIFCLRILNPTNNGSDLGLDDFSVISTFELSDTVHVQVKPVPDPQLEDIAACAGTTVWLDAEVGGATYLWSDGSTNATMPVTDPGAYGVFVDLNGCTVYREVEVLFDPVPQVDLGNDITLCEGQSATFMSATPGGTHLWSNGSTQPTLTTNVPGSYSLQQTIGACTASDTVVFNTSPLPLVDLGGPYTLCTGSGLELNAAQPGASYLWSNLTTGPSLLVTSGGTYTVEVTVNGCPATGSATVVEAPAPVLDLGNDTTLCQGATLTLGQVVPGATHLWQDGSTEPVRTVGAAGWYWLEARIGDCTVRDSLLITLSTPPTIPLLGSVSVCPDSLAALYVPMPTGTTLLWSSGATTPQVWLPAGQYQLTATENGCSSTADITIVELPPTPIQLGSDSVICPGSQLVLAPSGAWATLQWSTGESTPSITVDTPGSYSVLGTTAAGCPASDTVEVGMAVVGTVDLGADTILCQGEFHLLDATTADATHYQWNNGYTAPTLLAGGIGTYWVDVHFGPCVVSDSIHVFTVPHPEVDLGPDLLLCPGAEHWLDPGHPGLAHQWQDGSESEQWQVTAPGTYSVEVINGNGCSGTDTISVAYQAELPDLLGPDTLLCPGQVLDLSVGAIPGSMLWNTGDTGPTLQVSTPGWYSVAITDQGCTQTRSITVTYVPMSLPELGPDTAVCVGDQLTLAPSLTVGTDVLWEDGGTDPVRIIPGAGTYWVTFNMGHCSASDTVVVSAIPLPVLTTSSDTSICADQTTTLWANAPGATLLWSNGSTGATATAYPGSWSVTANAAGCSVTGTITVSALPIPLLPLPSDTMLCAGNAWAIHLNEPGVDYVWSDGVTGGVRTISEAGNIGLLATLGSCPVNHNLQVTVVDPIPLELGPDTVLCPGEYLSLPVNTQGATIIWGPGGSTSNLLTITSAGTYWAQLNFQGCLSQDTIQVGYTQVPVPELGPARSACADAPHILQVDAPGANVQWSTGSIGDTIAVLHSGIYEVQVSVDGCTLSDNVYVEMVPVLRSMDLPRTTAICHGHTIRLSVEHPEVELLWSTGARTRSITVLHPGLYTVAAIGPCVDAVDTVQVIAGDCLLEVNVPNAFTPDGDGMNELFLPVFPEVPEAFHFEVFDRWGRSVFISADHALGWDGRLRDEPAPSGVYVWQLHYRSPGNHGAPVHRLSGHVTLLR